MENVQKNEEQELFDKAFPRKSIPLPDGAEKQLPSTDEVESRLAKAMMSLDKEFAHELEAENIQTQTLSEPDEKPLPNERERDSDGMLAHMNDLLIKARANCEQIEADMAKSHASYRAYMKTMHEALTDQRRVCALSEAAIRSDRYE